MRPPSHGAAGGPRPEGQPGRRGSAELGGLGTAGGVLAEALPAGAAIGRVADTSAAHVARKARAPIATGLALHLEVNEQATARQQGHNGEQPGE